MKFYLLNVEHEPSWFWSLRHLFPLLDFRTSVADILRRSRNFWMENCGGWGTTADHLQFSKHALEQKERHDARREAQLVESEIRFLGKLFQ